MAKDSGYNESKDTELCGKKTAEDQPGTKGRGNKLPLGQRLVSDVVVASLSGGRLQ